MRAGRAVLRDLRRDGRDLLVGSLGMVTAVALVAVGAALWLGVRSVVLGEVFPLDVLEVAPAGGGGLDVLAVRLAAGPDSLEPEAVERLAALPGVAHVSPRVVVSVPAVARGGSALIGGQLVTELVVDGLDPAVLGDDVAAGHVFAAPAAGGEPCSSDADCGSGRYCGQRWGGPGRVCREPLPAVASRHLVELFNSGFRRSYGLPRLNPEFLVGTTFSLELGRSTFAFGARRTPLVERVRLVGFSERAAPMGVSLPLEAVRAINAHFGVVLGDRAHGALVVLRSPRAAPEVIAVARSLGLEASDRGAGRAATVMAVLGIVGVGLAAVLVAVATVMVAQAFTLRVRGRRREIGVWRAVGASRAQVATRLLGEAAALGLLAAGAGLLLAAIAGAGLESAVQRLAAELPYVPDRLLAAPWWLVPASLLGGILAAVAGAAPAALGAARRDPAELLSRR